MILKIIVRGKGFFIYKFNHEVPEKFPFWKCTDAVIGFDDEKSFIAHNMKPNLNN